MNETRIDCRVIGATVRIEICRKVEKKYRLNEADSMSTIYARALEDATRDVVLSPADLAAIAAEAKKNLEKRIEKRNKKK